MPQFWFPVKIYRGHYCVTVDYDYMTHLTDSMIVFHGMETYFQELGDVQKKGKKSWTYNIIFHEKSFTVELKPSKKIKGLYIKSTYNPKGKCIEKSLVVPYENLKYFPVINSDRNCSKWDLDYEEPNYPWLESFQAKGK